MRTMDQDKELQSELMTYMQFWSSSFYLGSARIKSNKRNKLEYVKSLHDNTLSDTLTLSVTVLQNHKYMDMEIALQVMKT